MPPYTAVLFDLDDTLFDHQFHRRAALAAVHAAAQLEPSISVMQLENSHEAHLQTTYRDLLDGKLTAAAMVATKWLFPRKSDTRNHARNSSVQHCVKWAHNRYGHPSRPLGPGLHEITAFEPLQEIARLFD
jgi:FMN phosphatase YigB (HAD superfamily)